MKRRTRRNPRSNGFSILNRSRYEERTYYNDEYRDPAILKTILIVAVVVLTIGAIVLIAKAAFFSGNKTEQTTKYIPSPTNNLPEETLDIPYRTDDANQSEETTPNPGDTTTSENTTTPENTTEPSSGSHDLSYKSDNDEVIELQKRLSELGYLRIKEPTTYYGDATKRAVDAFQRQHSLPRTGNVDDATYDLIFSASAKEYELKEGDEGDDVKIIQDILVELAKKYKGMDFSSSDATGRYGSNTKHAVRDFQGYNGLEKTGVADRATIDKMYEIYNKR